MASMFVMMLLLTAIAAIARLGARSGSAHDIGSQVLAGLGELRRMGARQQYLWDRYWNELNRWD